MGCSPFSIGAVGSELEEEEEVEIELRGNTCGDVMIGGDEGEAV